MLKHLFFQLFSLFAFCMKLVITKNPKNKNKSNLFICITIVLFDFQRAFHIKSLCRLIHKPIEHNDRTSSPNFEFPVFEADEDDVEGIPDEISRLLEQEKKITLSCISRISRTANWGINQKKKRKKKSIKKNNKEREGAKSKDQKKKQRKIAPSKSQVD